RHTDARHAILGERVHVRFWRRSSVRCADGCHLGPSDIPADAPVRRDRAPASSGMSPAPALSVQDLMKAFAGPPVLAGLTLEVPTGGLTAVLGPSGCGKTTLLRLIAGFERADAGTIRVGERVVCDERIHVAPEHRGVGFVAQEGALFPHLDVAANVA